MGCWCPPPPQIKSYNTSETHCLTQSWFNGWKTNCLLWEILLLVMTTWLWCTQISTKKQKALLQMYSVWKCSGSQLPRMCLLVVIVHSTTKALWYGSVFLCFSLSLSLDHPSINPSKTTHLIHQSASLKSTGPPQNFNG